MGQAERKFDRILRFALAASRKIISNIIVHSVGINENVFSFIPPSFAIIANL